MRIAVIGAGGLRTPILVNAMRKRAAPLGITDISLMDTDQAALKRMSLLSSGLAEGRGASEKGMTITAAATLQEAVAGSDFVITTFRAGGMEERVRDERIARARGVLGQETTGFGGFSMALRSLPILGEVIAEMRRGCPGAWLVNFANPSGLLTEAAFNFFGWERTVGICDAPSQIHGIAAAALGAERERIEPRYFGLNHLGWFSGFVEQGLSGPTDRMPEILGVIEAAGSLPGFPFPGWFLSSLGLIPNEYLFYYYFREESLAAQRRQEKTRGETITEMNRALLAELDPPLFSGAAASAMELYHAYIRKRQETPVGWNLPGGDGTAGPARDRNPYIDRFVSAMKTAIADQEGYPGVALDVIGCLSGNPSPGAIVNVRNSGSIFGMADADVVEIPVHPGADGSGIVPASIGAIPRHCLGLMLQVKEFEKRTIEAFAARSRTQACAALALHPLIGDIEMAQTLVGDLEAERGCLFPHESGDFRRKDE